MAHGSPKGRVDGRAGQCLFTFEHRQGQPPRSNQQYMAVGRQTGKDRRKVIEALRELMRALDRRVPRLERSGERQIARDAAALRDKALRQIADLETSST